jgi:hypothetical protein
MLAAMSTRALLLVACCAVGVVVPAALGDSHTGRLSAHEGLHLVHVDDAPVREPGQRRPRQTVVVVIDGLGHLEAQTMRSTELLAARGQCRLTDVGPLSLSRPVYAAISTGLEPDRSGVRFNDDPAPLAARSFWELARAAGLRVSASSELTWWAEMFPRGFDEVALIDPEEDPFRRSPPADLRLVHPLDVDHAGHESGAGSPAYRAAVDRVDRQLAGFLARDVDLAQDLVVVTADHGHSLHGGHGGRQDRIARVLTCYAGLGVRHGTGDAALATTAIGPSIALLLGLPFPAEMRAGDDGLDALWDIADPAVLPSAWLDDRRRAVARFREANAAAVATWLPASEGSWDRFYAWHRARQQRVALLFAGLLGVILALQARAHRGGARRFGPLFVAGFCGLAWALQVGLRGSFDLSSVANREDFLTFTSAIGVVATVAAIVVHWRLRRDLGALLLDLAAISAVGTLLSLAHPTALGWQLGFPVPPPPAFFFPYWAALFLGAFNGIGLVFGLVALATRRSAAPRPA